MKIRIRIQVPIGFYNYDESIKIPELIVPRLPPELDPVINPPDLIKHKNILFNEDTSYGLPPL